jgi:DNA polymerase III delta prime subunit
MPEIHISETERDPQTSSRETWDTDDTQQATAIQTGRALQYKSTDAEQIRDRFGIPKMDVESFVEANGHDDAVVYPDMVVHEKDPTRTRSSKGTDCLIRGDRDCGKTTQALNLAAQLMGENDERVVWRGRRGGSGWLPLRFWATVYLPADLETEAIWVREGEEPDDESMLADVDDLESVVRDVVYYDGIYDLLDKLGERPGGTFNVVYPDPAFRDCKEITRKTDRGQFAGGLPFTPAWEADLDAGRPATPLGDWWAPFLVARTEYGPQKWMAWLCDEAGDLYPENAPNNDGRQLHDLITMLRGVWATSRKRYLSLYMWVHHEENLHAELRREFKWRICMPDGTPNPRKGVRSSHPIGMKGAIQMRADLMSYRKDRYEALCYNGPDWAHFTWSDVAKAPADSDRWLSITMRPGDSPPKPQGSDAEDNDEAASQQLEYDHRVFGEWQNASAHRLIVKEPGDGYLSVHGATIGEPLESPVDGLRFREELRDRDTHREVVMIDGDGEEIVVAKLPIDEMGSGQVGGVAGD